MKEQMVIVDPAMLVRTRWEYRQEVDPATDELDALGADGWEAFGVAMIPKEYHTYGDRDSRTLVLLKRQVFP